MAQLLVKAEPSKETLRAPYKKEGKQEIQCHRDQLGEVGTLRLKKKVGLKSQFSS